MKKLLTIAFLALTAASTGPVYAQLAPAAKWYAGAAIGQARSNVDAGEVDDFVRSLGYGSPSTSAEDKDMAYRLSAGYRFSPALSIELFYADLGAYSTRTTVATPSPGSVSADYKANGYGLDVLLSAPVAPQFSVYGRLGIMQARTEASFSSSGSFVLLNNGASKDKTAQHFGLGFQYDVTPELGLRAEVETFRKLGDDSTGGELKLDVLSLGAVFRF